MRARKIAALAAATLTLTAVLVGCSSADDTATTDTSASPAPERTAFLLETSDPLVVEIVNPTDGSRSDEPTYVTRSPGTATINVYAGLQDKEAIRIMTFTVTVVAG